MTGAVNILKDIGAKLFVLSIGNEPSNSELIKLVSKPSDVLSVPDVGNPGVTSIVQHISKSGKTRFWNKG